MRLGLRAQLHPQVRRGTQSPGPPLPHHYARGLPVISTSAASPSRLLALLLRERPRATAAPLDLGGDPEAALPPGDGGFSACEKT